ncbi:MAG: hypothetical protein A2V76_02610 [Candidatus Aminicenantes bacterium RBG_16_63_14]|nr:MAG: hypothetical protein A2V76_02610 [Candidatus Aminicenantes bacterium RBG_16_63_14]
MENITIVINDAPYGTEKAWNALRLAKTLVVIKQKVQVFLLGDAVALVKKGQKTPTGYYNLAQMVTDLIASGVEVRVCVTCIDSRGLRVEELVDGVVVGKMLDLAHWVKEGSKVLTF